MTRPSTGPRTDQERRREEKFNLFCVQRDSIFVRYRKSCNRHDLKVRCCPDVAGGHRRPHFHERRRVLVAHLMSLRDGRLCPARRRLWRSFLEPGEAAHMWPQLPKSAKWNLPLASMMRADPAAAPAGQLVATSPSYSNSVLSSAVHCAARLPQPPCGKPVHLRYAACAHLVSELCFEARRQRRFCHRKTACPIHVRSKAWFRDELLRMDPQFQPAAFCLASTRRAPLPWRALRLVPSGAGALEATFDMHGNSVADSASTAVQSHTATATTRMLSIQLNRISLSIWSTLRG